MTQCGQALPLFMGMVPAPTKQQATAKLIESLHAANGNMVVGMFGIKWVDHHVYVFVVLCCCAIDCGCVCCC